MLFLRQASQRSSIAWTTAERPRRFFVEGGWREGLDQGCGVAAGTSAATSFPFKATNCGPPWGRDPRAAFTELPEWIQKLPFRRRKSRPSGSMGRPPLRDTFGFSKRRVHACRATELHKVSPHRGEPWLHPIRVHPTCNLSLRSPGGSMCRHEGLG